jgi:hypothetical protein
MNVIEELRKRHREVLRARGQPVGRQPGKRARRIAAKRALGRGRSEYEGAVILFNARHNPNWAQSFYARLRGLIAG